MVLLLLEWSCVDMCLYLVVEFVISSDKITWRVDSTACPSWKDGSSWWRSWETIKVLIFIWSLSSVFMIFIWSLSSVFMIFFWSLSSVFMIFFWSYFFRMIVNALDEEFKNSSSNKYKYKSFKYIHPLIRSVVSGQWLLVICWWTNLFNSSDFV